MHKGEGGVWFEAVREVEGLEGGRGGFESAKVHFDYDIKYDTQRHGDDRKLSLDGQRRGCSFCERMREYHWPLLIVEDRGRCKRYESKVNTRPLYRT